MRDFNDTLHNAMTGIVSSDIKKIFIILVDISGYTQFIKLHKISLLHAEKIIGELMESILDEVEVPVMAHEILGDAISMYAVDEGDPNQGKYIYDQLHKYFMAFRDREAKLISECSLCACESCKQVSKLRLKAIVHYGEAAFTTVHKVRKISGENIIISHRLLKNTVPSKEYILITEDFIHRCGDVHDNQLEPHTENYEDVGSIKVFVKTFDHLQVHGSPLSLFQKIKSTIELDGYLIGRLFKKNILVYKNLPE